MAYNAALFRYEVVYWPCSNNTAYKIKSSSLLLKERRSDQVDAENIFARVRLLSLSLVIFWSISLLKVLVHPP